MAENGCFLNPHTVHFKILVNWRAQKVSSCLYNRANFLSVIISLLNLKDLSILQ